MNTATLQSWWRQRAAREQGILKLAALLIVLFLLWSIALAPALRTLRSFEGQRLSQEAQLQSMLRMQAQAQALKAQPGLTAQAANQALQDSVQQAFGTKATITSSAGNVTVTLRGVSADALAQWLSTARIQARASPIQARLTRSDANWSGTLQMGLPAP